MIRRCQRPYVLWLYTAGVAVLSHFYFNLLYFSVGLGRLKAEYGRVICFPNWFD